MQATCSTPIKPHIPYGSYVRLKILYYGMSALIFWGLAVLRGQDSDKSIFVSNSRWLYENISPG